MLFFRFCKTLLAIYFGFQMKNDFLIGMFILEYFFQTWKLYIVNLNKIQKLSYLLISIFVFDDLWLRRCDINFTFDLLNRWCSSQSIFIKYWFYLIHLSFLVLKITIYFEDNYDLLSWIHFHTKIYFLGNTIKWILSIELLYFLIFNYISF